MAVGRISGPLLKANLLRDGVDLAFETDLLYLDVVNGRVGVKTRSPQYDLDVNGTIRSTNIQATSQADIATFTLTGNTFSSTSSTINLTPSGTNPVVYQGKIVTGNLQLSTNTIETTGTNTNLVIQTTGTGVVNINSNTLVNGNLHATGNITADGNITIGDSNTDNITFNADINSDIIPDADNTYDLGDPLQRWKTIYTNDFVSTNVISDAITVNGIDLVLPQGNIFYVSTNGNDSNAGVHENNPFATLKHALSVATEGSVVFIYPGIYEEEFPLTVPVGVTVRGAGIRAVKIVPTTGTRYNDAFLLNGETTVEDLAVADFFSGGNYFTVTSSTTNSATFNVGTAPFAHTYVSGGTITFGSNTYNITGATYTYTTGVTTVTYVGPAASGQIFLSNLTFSCNGSTRIFPDNGYAFRFANDITVTSRSPYIRNITVITRGSTTSPTDPYGFDAGDAGKGAYIDGAYANAASKEASMLFHSATFITPNVDCITAQNGVRIEWLNSFTYFANRGIYAFSNNYGFAQQGQTRLRINSRTGTWATGNTVTYYDTNGTTVLGTGTISSVDGNYVNLTGRCLGFETVTDRQAKTIYAQGNAKLSTAQKKFGTASLSLDGVGDYITCPTQPDFNFGTGAFCLEAWIYNTNQPAANQVIFDFRTTNPEVTPTFYINATTNTLRLAVNGSAVIDSGSAIPLNTWTHIALAKSGTSTKMFINGTQVGSTYTDNNTYLQGPLTLGARYDTTTPFFGYIDDVRISKGVARYTSNFTAPTSALTGDLNTVLLLHFNGLNNSTTILDDGITYQDLRTSAGGSASLIDFADYSDFGAEIRAIGSANVYGNYGVYGDGPGVIAYLISQNFAYIGTGKKSNNDPNDRIAANEVVELNHAKIYYTSVDNEGNFKVGDAFYVNQKTGDVLFNGQALEVTSLSGVTFTDGTNTTTITPTNIDTGNIRISGNTVESLTGDLNVTAASGAINLQNNTFVTGNLDVTGNITLGGNIQVGDATTDTINFVGGINSNLVPATTNTYDLGSASYRWQDVYLNRAEIDGLVIDNNVIQTTLNNDDLTLGAHGTGKVVVPNNNVLLSHNLTVTQDVTVTTGTTYLKATTINGTVTQTGDINQTGTFTTSGNTEVTGNITATGYIQLPAITIDNNTIQTTTTNTNLQLTANGTGNVIFEGLKVQDNNIQSIATNADIVLTPQGTGLLVINSNQSLVIPVGTTSDRPGTPTNGMIRYNTTLSRYEGYNNGHWLAIGGVQDEDGNTYIIAEATPGANDNVLYFYVNNVLMAYIDATKLWASRFETNNIAIYDNNITTTASGTDINVTTPGTGGVKIGNLRIRNNTITNVVSNAVTEFNYTGDGYVKIAGTYGFVIPSGNAVTERPSVTEVGMVRFNTEYQLVEVFNGASWTSVAGASGGVTGAEAQDIGIQTVLMLG